MPFRQDGGTVTQLGMHPPATRHYHRIGEADSRKGNNKRKKGSNQFEIRAIKHDQNEHQDKLVGSPVPKLQSGRRYRMSPEWAGE